MTEIVGELSAVDMRFAIVAAQWNASFTDNLVKGALSALEECGAKTDAITVVRVPGSFEIPNISMRLAKSKSFDAVIALGVLIEGETDHYRLIADEVATGLSKISLETGVPVSFGVITADSVEKVRARCGDREANKGWESAMAAVSTASVLRQLNQSLDI